jgi:hypothetical protein
MWTDKVIEATQETFHQFQTGQLILLTESDLKTFLANQIRQRMTGNITVNTESPWYDTYVTHQTYFVDITAFDNDKLKITYDASTNRKGYKYEDKALAIELKYFRYKADVQEIAGDFTKMRLLIQAPLNDCFIIAAARTKELFDEAEIFMNSQMNNFRAEYNNRVKVYLLGVDNLIEIV